METCSRCGGPKAAHFEPDKIWPNGICVCAMPDARPCGCPGFKPQEKKVR